MSVWAGASCFYIKAARCSPVMLAPLASIYVLNTAFDRDDVDGRDKPDHDGKCSL